MDLQFVRKTFKEKLRPTPAQERALDEVLWRCRMLYNTALEQRVMLWRQRGRSISRYQQEAELKDLRAEFPEYAAIHSHVLQDVLARLDTTYQAFFRRVQQGEKAGFPRFKGRNRCHSFTFKEYGNGARLDNGYLVLAKIGRIRVHWSRPIEGTPKTVTVSREADRWYVAISCADVSVRPPYLRRGGCRLEPVRGSAAPFAVWDTGSLRSGTPATVVQRRYRRSARSILGAVGGICNAREPEASAGALGRWPNSCRADTPP
jgi:transposase